jgi:hypothetical protein
LQLNKETIEVLNEMQLNQVHGGTNATVVETITQSSFKCFADIYGKATIIDDAAKGMSFWNCPDEYQDDAAKSQWIGNNNPGLDNTAFTQGRYFCIKAY